MIKPVRVIEAEVVSEISCPGKIPTVQGYLRQLATLCLEVAQHPRMLPVFLGILRLAPATITSLLRARRLTA